MARSLETRLHRLEQTIAPDRKGRIKRIIVLTAGSHTKTQICEHLRSIGVEPEEGDFHPSLVGASRVGNDVVVTDDIPIRLTSLGQAQEPRLISALERQDQMFGSFEGMAA